MIIELFGLPGSGKTTLKKKLLKHLKKSKIKAYSYEDFLPVAYRRSFGNTGSIFKIVPVEFLFKFKINYILGMNHKIELESLEKYMYSHKEFIKNYYELISTSGFTYDKRAHRYIVKMISQFAVFENYSKDNECFVIDEGFVHRLHTLFGYQIRSEFDKNLMNKYMKAIPVPDLAIKIEANIETCKKRIGLRGLPKRMHRMSENEINLFFERNNLLFDYISEVIKVENINYYEIENEGLNKRETNSQLDKIIDAFINN